MKGFRAEIVLSGAYVVHHPFADSRGVTAHPLEVSAQKREKIRFVLLDALFRRYLGFMRDVRFHATDILLIAQSAVFATVSALNAGKHRIDVAGFWIDGTLIAAGGFVLIICAVFLLTRFLDGSISRIAGWAKLFYPQALYGSFFIQAIFLSQLISEGRSFDGLFVRLDELIFGYQPATALFRVLGSSSIVTELCFFGYFLFYPLIVLGPWFLYARGKVREAERELFIITASFFMLDLLYLVFPVQGPKYFFPALRSGYGVNFSGYLFTSLLLKPVSTLNLAGAAFPSAHVLVSTIAVGLIARRNRTAGFALLPFLALLFFATVYIYAHYAVDVIGGVLLTGPAYLAASRLYRPFRKAALRLGRVFRSLGTGHFETGAGSGKPDESEGKPA